MPVKEEEEEEEEEEEDKKGFFKRNVYPTRGVLYIFVFVYNSINLFPF